MRRIFAPVLAADIARAGFDPACRQVVTTEDMMVSTILRSRPTSRALQPKRVVTIPGGQFDPYLGQFPTSIVAALARFKEHLA
jgi:hypothetical protein